MEVSIGGQHVLVKDPVPLIDNPASPLHGKYQIVIGSLPFKNPGIMKFMPLKLHTDFKIGILFIHLNNGVAVPLRAR